jgi:hypothetical protein
VTGSEPAKLTFMLRPITLSLLSLAFCLLSRAQESKSKPDFSGRWEIVKERSDFGRMSPPVRMTLTAEKRNGSLHSVQTIETPDGEHVEEGNWYLDGKRHTYDKPVPGYLITRWDGNTLVTERQSNDGHYKDTIKLNMESDGQTAVETVDTLTPNGRDRLRLVWRRSQ